MHRLSTLLILTLLMGSVAGATTTTYVTADGVWWNALTENQKALAMIAELDGFHGGYNLGDFYQRAYDGELFNVLRKTNHRSWARLEAVAIPYYKKHGSDYIEPDFSYRTFSVLATKVDDFYKIYPARMTVHVSAILPCIANDAKAKCKFIGANLDEMAK